MLTSGELDRYQRQIKIIGEEGQEKLKRAKVFVAGAGGLGSVISVYLASAGVGNIKIVDRDIVELSNLNRQILYRETDIGRTKANCAGKELGRINPNVQIEAISDTINEDNAAGIMHDCDIIVDALDNFPTRYILNRVAQAKNVPFVHGAIEGFYGQTTTIIPGKTACFKCMFPEAPPIETWPIIGVTCGILGCIQSTEVIKYILGIGNLLENKLLMIDGLNAAVEEIAIERNPRCRDCG
jgi:adenylyltransferase/sulfurtransferase